MRFLGLDLAPIWIPFERRLQTFAVFHYVTTFLFFGTMALFLLIFSLTTRYYWIGLLYVAWYFYDLNQSSRGGRRFECIRRLHLWNWFRDYFPVSMIKTADLDPEHNYIIGMHPHGIMGIGAFCNFMTEASGFSHVFPGITSHILSLKMLHYFPVYREYIMALGVCDVSKESIQYLMKGKGVAALIMIGGAKEALDANPGHTKLVLQNRKGFAKIALQNGAYLVPAFSFGENEVYRLLFRNPPGSSTRIIQRKIQQKLGFAPVVFVGRGIFNYTFGLLPHRKKIITVVGKPIPVEKRPNPSQAEIDSLHQEYMMQLKALFDHYKATCGYANEQLEFIE